MSPVTDTSAAAPAVALSHFTTLLAFETDCWDVHQSMAEGDADFVLFDVRGRGAWDVGHIDGATHHPHLELTEDRLSGYGADTLFVVYCAGPHCNGADMAAARLAGLGRPVKKMIGGITGWIDEGFDLVTPI